MRLCESAPGRSLTQCRLKLDITRSRVPTPRGRASSSQTKPGCPLTCRARVTMFGARSAWISVSTLPGGSAAATSPPWQPKSRPLEKVRLISSSLSQSRAAPSMKRKSKPSRPGRRAVATTAHDAAVKDVHGVVLCGHGGYMARFRAILKSTVQACADYIWPPMCAGV